MNSFAVLADDYVAPTPTPAAPVKTKTPKLANASHHLYKTELCIHFEKHGHCNLGSRCAYAHGQHQLREKSDESAPAKDPLYKTILCKSFNSDGICTYGAHCMFAHGPDDLRDKPRKIPIHTRELTLGDFITEPKQKKRKVVKKIAKPAGDIFAKLSAENPSMHELVSASEDILAMASHIAKMRADAPVFVPQSQDPGFLTAVAVAEVVLANE